MDLPRLGVLTDGENQPLCSPWTWVMEQRHWRSGKDWGKGVRGFIMIPPQHMLCPSSPNRTGQTKDALDCTVHSQMSIARMLVPLFPLDLSSLFLSLFNSLCVSSFSLSPPFLPLLPASVAVGHSYKSTAIFTVSLCFFCFLFGFNVFLICLLFLICFYLFPYHSMT